MQEVKTENTEGLNASQFFSPLARNLLAPGHSVTSFLCPSSLKSAVKADFLTLGPIKASNDVVMQANNINNIATVPSISGNSNETRIEAGNMASLNAIKDVNGNGGNITNIGATIKGGNLVYLTAENNITNKALVDYLFHF